jgi:predicted chitinase
MANYTGDAKRLLEMADTTQFQIEIADYTVEALVELSKIFLKYKAEFDKEGYDLVLKDKINLIKETRLDKTKAETKAVKSISTVIAKMETESIKEVSKSKSKPTNPKLVSASSTPKTSGLQFNTPRGQGDFFGNASAFRFIKSLVEDIPSNNVNPAQQGFDFDKKSRVKKSSPNTKTSRVTVSHLEPKALKQLKDVLGLVQKAEKGEGSGKPKVKRESKHEKDKLAIRKQEADLRKEHLDEIKFKHRSDRSLELRKLREKAKSDTARYESYRVREEFREKVEKNRTKRLKIAADLEKQLSDNHVELNKIKLSTAKVNRQRAKDQAEARERLQKHRAEQSDKIRAERARNMEQRRMQQNRNQMERHLHGIHPALGLLYGMTQNRKEAQASSGNSGQGSGIATLLGAGAAGGVGAGILGKGAGLFKRGAKFLSKGPLGLLGASALVGGIEAHESGSNTKGLLAAGGGLAGGQLGTMMGTKLGSRFGIKGAAIGGFAGGVIGFMFGETQAKQLFNKFEQSTNKDSLFGDVNKSSDDSLLKLTALGAPKAMLEFANNIVNKDTKTPNPGNVATGKITKISDKQRSFEAAMTAAGITDPKERAMLLAQVQHESGNFKYSTEMGNASYFQKYEGRQDLGNTQVGDGEKFKGRGYIQLTGRANYEKAGKDLGLDLVNNPELAANPQIAEKIALWYWQGRKTKDGRSLGEAARQGDIMAVTKGINGGTNGFVERDALFNANLARMTPPNKADTLASAETALMQKANEAKAKPTTVVMQGGNTTSSPTVVNNNTTINAPTTDATIRQIAVAAMYPART